ncbi:hypothetical protein IscW_ISCW019284 [Ixodes scapularis]|uniref:Uncharacterized protein n=1 Tax=Ixodes scapularis TaxID=6945 RepID=B7PT67_IXOSC|nr:hypothetical protein IscW_ISCW019284 [Ixodes scapularis]|eukprot:XP_002403938.1 hypothetical protein IscW_ISCW019284 [Ixodes scapularis]
MIDHCPATFIVFNPNVDWKTHEAIHHQLDSTEVLAKVNRKPRRDDSAEFRDLCDPPSTVYVGRITVFTDVQLCQESLGKEGEFSNTC